MDMIGKVRRMKMRDGVSISEISRKTGLSRNTVKKWLKAPAAVEPRYERAQKEGKLSAFEATLVAALKTFDGCVERAARVSSTCLVTVGRNRYSVPCEWAGHMVSTRLYPSRVDVVAVDAPLPHRGDGQRVLPVPPQLSASQGQGQST